MTQLFLPSLGGALWIIGSLLYVTYYWDEVKQFDKRVAIPLGVIVLAIGLSGLTATGNGFVDTLEAKVAPLGMGLALLSLYLTSRVLGKAIFKPFVIGTVVVAVGVVVHAIMFLGQVTGGYVFENNYDAVIGYLVFGTVLYTGKWRLQLISLVLVAVFLTGSPEGVFVTGVLGVAVLVREHLNWGLVRLLTPTVLVVSVWFSVGWGQELYSYTVQVARDQPAQPAIQSIQSTEASTDEVVMPVPETTVNATTSQEIPRKAVTYRFEQIKVALTNVAPLGSGYVVTAYFTGIVHNVPLIMVQELGYPGIVGSVAWMWVCVFGVWKTKWKYAWVALVAMGVFDHFTWDQFIPCFPALLGVSTTQTDDIENDKLIKKETEKEEAI